MHILCMLSQERRVFCIGSLKHVLRETREHGSPGAERKPLRQFRRQFALPRFYDFTPFERAFRTLTLEDHRMILSDAKLRFAHLPCRIVRGGRIVVGHREESESAIEIYLQLLVRSAMSMRCGVYLMAFRPVYP